jgi:hypothetical protein
VSAGAKQIDPFAEAQSLAAPAAAAAPGPTTTGPATPAAGESWKAEAGGMALIEALALASRTAEELTGRAVDAVVNSELNAHGGWTIDIDVLEAKAKMGTNDLLCCYRIGFGADGSLVGYSRLRRYHREDG